MAFGEINSATKKGLQAIRKTPSGQRREHEGRLPQPGVPAGPRNTPIPVVPITTPEHSSGTRGSHLPSPPKGTSVGGTGVDLSGVLKTIHHLYESTTHVSPAGSDIARHYAEGEAKNLGEVAKANADRIEKAEPLQLKVPSGKELQALGTILSPVGADEGASIAEKALGKATAQASNATTAAKLGEKALIKLKAAPKGVVKDIKEAPARKVARIKSAPARARALPTKVKRAATTPEGRRQAVKGAESTALHHPIKAGVPIAAAVPVGAIPGKPKSNPALAFLEGTANATLHHPGEVASATARGALGALTAPLALTYAAGKSAAERNPEPLEDTASTLAKGTVELGKKLASGNAKEVEQTTRKETGLTPFIPVPHIVKDAKETDFYKDNVRGRVRDSAEARRVVKRESRIAAEKKAFEADQAIEKKRAGPRVEGRGAAKRIRLVRKEAEKPVRTATEDSARKGEKYVLRRTGNLIEKKRGQHEIARHVDRMTKEGELAGDFALKPIVKELRKSKLVDNSKLNASDALGFVEKYGVPHDEAAGLTHVKAIYDSFPKNDYGKVPGGKTLSRHAAKWILDHPQLFHDEHFWKAVNEFHKQSEAVGTSERNRYLASAISVVNPRRLKEGRDQVLLPEEKVPKAVEKFLPQRSKPWSRPEAWDLVKSREDDLRVLREAGDHAAAKALEREQKGFVQGMKGLMKPPEHGGAVGGISTTRAVPYTDEMLHGFTKQMADAHKEYGYRTPAAYVADKVPSGLEDHEIAGNFNVPVKKVWPSRGENAASGNTEASFESLVSHSIKGPRMRNAVTKGIARVYDKAARQVNGKRLLTRSDVERAINKHEVPPGTLFVRPQLLRAALKSEHGEKAVEQEIEHAQMLQSSPSAELHKALDDAQAHQLPGEKYAAMNAAEMEALMGHMKGIGGISKEFAKGTNFATRTILNSPAFLAIRFTHEIPAALSLGRAVVDLPAAIKNLKTISKLDPETRAEMLAPIGSGTAFASDPAVRSLGTEPWLDPGRAAAKPEAWRQAWRLATGNLAGRFDEARTGMTREAIASAKIEHDFKAANKGFNVWRRSAHNLYNNEEEAVKAMQGMDRTERLAYTTSHPQLGDKLMKAMHGMAGNWTSFTVFEKHIAPFLLFYGFQRYSVQWMLYHFPLDHPVVATALNMLGQVNAAELRKGTGGEVPVLQNTYPVVQNGKGKEPTVLPAGLRSFPGLASLQEAALTKNPAEALGSLSPEIQIPLQTLLGQSFYTGEKLSEPRLDSLLHEIAALSPVGRLTGLSDLGKKPSSTLGKTFKNHDPLREQRSVLSPAIGQTMKQLREEDALEGGVKNKYGGPVPEKLDSVPAVIEAISGAPGGKVDPKKLAEVLAEVKAQKQGGEVVKKQETPFFPKDEPEWGPEQFEALNKIEEAAGDKKPSESASGKYSSGNKYSSSNKYGASNKYSSSNKYASSGKYE